MGYRLGTLPIDAVLLKGAIGFRIFALVWMGALIAAIFEAQPMSQGWTAAAMAAATFWTLVTVVASRRLQLVGSLGFLVADGLVAAFVALTPAFSGAERHFYAGYPMSWVVLMVWAHGLTGGLIAAGVALTAIITPQILGIPPLFDLPEIIGSVAVFTITPLVLGWALDVLRRTEVELLATQQALEREREARARFEERSGLADRLHDSVLQALKAIKRIAEDPNEVRHLVRVEQRELQEMIDEMHSRYEHGLRASLRRAAYSIEDLYGVEVAMVASGDHDLTPGLVALVEAAREAMVNAAKHGDSPIRVTLEVVDGRAIVFVDDRGPGFDPRLVGETGGIQRSIIDRVKRHGGEGAIESAPGAGTRVTLSIPVA